MSLNVSPVTGMTPPQIAVQLRGIIRHAYLSQLQAPQQNTGEIKQGLREALNEVNLAMKELETIAQQRRPRETRKRIEKMRVTCLFELHQQIGRIRPETIDHIIDFSQAYALVQALPTIDQSPLGREENTIRAITAILKVYWGLKLEDTGKDLPDLIGELLEQVKNHATNGQPIQAVPTPDVDDEIEHGDLDLADFDDDE